MTTATALTRRVYASATPPGQSSPRISINPMGNVPNKIREDFTLLHNPMKISSAKLLLVVTGRRWLILAGVCLRGKEEAGTPACARVQGGSSHRDFTCGKVFSKNAIFKS